MYDIADDQIARSLLSVGFVVADQYYVQLYSDIISLFSCQLHGTLAQRINQFFIYNFFFSSNKKTWDKGHLIMVPLVINERLVWGYISGEFVVVLRSHNCEIFTI
jgi:hypothetical protein